MTHIVVKICGLTRARDVDAAVAAGVDAVGFVFASSHRRISVAQARQLVERIPAGILRVGLFLDQDTDAVTAVLKSLTLDLLQFHGQENSTYCETFGLPYLKAVSMQDNQSLLRAKHEFPGAAGLLLDSHVSGGRGGSGKRFDWRLVQAQAKHVWLAGGLNADNVAKAVETVKPYAVDVSSGVELRPGIKDPDKINAFVNAVRRAEKSA